MPQFVLRHGECYAEEGSESWRVRPSPTGHERTTSELSAIEALPLAEQIGSLQAYLENAEGEELTSLALPVEVRLPKIVPRGKKGGGKVAAPV